MIPFTKIIKTPLKDTKGFSMMELIVVIAIIGVLASIGVFSYIPMRAKALDAAAHSDARNIVSSVVNAIMNNEDVDFDKTGTGGAVGAIESDKITPREPVYVLSNGVAAVITGDSIQGINGNETIFTALIYHIGGTNDPFTLSGKKEFSCSVDEAAGTSTVPN